MRREDFIRDSLDGWSDINPDRDLSALAVVQNLIWAGRIAENLLARAAAASGVKRRGDYEVLALLRRREPELQRPANLADELLASPSGLTAKIDRLEQSGLVERVDDKIDRRSVLVRLTDEGRSVTDGAFELSLELYHAFLAEMPQPDREMLGGLLARLLRRLEQLSASRHPWKDDNSS